MFSDFSFLAWFIPALAGSSVLGGVLVQYVIHRTRRHITQNIVDLAEAAVKVGDRAVLGQVAQLISPEAAAQAPRRADTRKRYEAAIITFVIAIFLAVGVVVGSMIFVDGALKAGTMTSELET
jgi:predicted phage tail protein